jgi:hypothetical protein
MRVYLGKGRKSAGGIMVATNATMTGLASRTENLGHKLHTDVSPLLNHLIINTRTV